MFSNYQWLLIGVIIACSCLVIYGSSSTSIKEGLSPPCPIDPHYKRCWNECTGNDINCHSRPTTDAMRAAGAPEKHETCDPGYKSACGPGPQYNITDSPPGCPLPCVKATVSTGTPAPSPPCCKQWVQTLNCQGDGPIDTGSDYKLDHTGKGFCATTINPGSSGYCLCADGSKQNIVNCGHEPFVCEDVCKPYCTPTPPAPPPPPPSCAAFLSHNDCPTGTTSKAVNTTCSSGAACGASDCCTPNPQCSSLGSCPAYSNMSNPDLVCQRPACDNTIGGECCAANPVCSADVCDLNTQVFSGAGRKCVGPKCAPIECCKPRAQCSGGVTCNPNLYDEVSDYSSKYCKDIVCELSECCKPDPTCNKYKCPPYYTDKPNMSAIKCGAGLACDTKQCCDMNPTCSSYFTGPGGVARNGGCPAHQHLKKTAAEIRCLGPKCTAKECCGTDVKCSSFKCPEDNLYHNYAHILDAANVPCTDDHCTQKQCCVATPTYALPKVQTYPVYKTNMFHPGGGSTLNQ